MKPKQIYGKTSKHSYKFIDWIVSLFVEIKTQIFLMLKWLWAMYKQFWYDIKLWKWVKKFASIMAVILCTWYLIYLPISWIIEWWIWKYRDWSINYKEYSLPQKNDIEKEILTFSQDYSNAQWTNCEWFKKHDVDIWMWQKYGRLYRPSYECAGFSPHNRVLLYPIYISTIQKSEWIIKLEVKLARIDYDEEKANKYTTVKASLWRLADEKNIWRIDKMDNIQKWQLSDDK